MKFKDDKNMDKPLKDWTLEEVKEYCKTDMECPDCRFFKGSRGGAHVCLIGNILPGVWDLNDKPRFTEEEIEAVKAILTLWPEADAVTRHNAYNDFVGVYIDGEHAASLDAVTFPSLEPGETARLKDILGE